MHSNAGTGLWWNHLCDMSVMDQSVELSYHVWHEFLHLSMCKLKAELGK